MVHPPAHPPARTPPSFRRLLADRVAEKGDVPALGVIHAGRLAWRTWREAASDAVRCAEVLLRQGIRPGDRIAQAAGNDYAWIMLDWAALLVRAVHVPLHHALPPAELSRQLSHADVALVVGREGRDRNPRWTTPQSLGLPLGDPSVFLPPLPADRLQGGLAMTAAAADDVATLLYTSGTGGVPRAVALTHGNLLANTAAIVAAAASTREEMRLIILPLAHIYARTCDLYSWLYRGSRMILAESRETLFRDCQLARPTALNGVPYFYQKVLDQLGARRQPPTAENLREILGGAVARCYCGGAAVAPELEQTYAAAGLPLLSGYGLTEAAPVVTSTTPDDYVIGSVGRPLPNLEVRIAEDGEIAVRGPSVMRGYWKDDLATAAALRDGWLFTGDIGEFTPTGQLRIRGRKKDLLALSTGKKVWPARLEAQLAASPLIEQACLTGEGRPFLTAILVPNPVALRAAIKQRRWFVWSRRRALRHPGVRSLYREEIDRLLAAAADHEQVGEFVLIDRPFSIEHGEATPKLSLCRDAVAERFRQEIEAMYRRTGARAPRSSADGASA